MGGEDESPWGDYGGDQVTVKTNIIGLVVTLLAELLSIIQWANGWNLIPAKYVPYAMMAIGVIPKVLSLVAQYSNPDGTPANQAWLAGVKDFVGMAEKLYESYRAHTGGVSVVTQQPIPNWAALPQPIQDAWRAAAAACPSWPRS